MIKEKAYAKINLFLNITDKREDGFHDLEMVMASLDFFDIISIKKRDDSSIQIDTDKFITDNPQDNLVYKVAKYLQDTYEIEKGATIAIQKNIPMGAGLAGGSADAAATIRGLNKLWSLGLNLKEMAKIGLKFGSDIPFCIYNKLCIARGRGEELVFLDQKITYPILLVNPNTHISTKEVFSNVKKENLKEKKISNMTSGIYNKNYELITLELYNYLEEIVFQIEPKVKEIKDQMVRWGIQGSLMSGSGATVFGIDKDKSKLKEVAKIFHEDHFQILTKMR